MILNKAFMRNKYGCFKPKKKEEVWGPGTFVIIHEDYLKTTKEMSKLEIDHCYAWATENGFSLNEDGHWIRRKEKC